MTTRTDLAAALRLVDEALTVPSLAAAVLVDPEAFKGLSRAIPEAMAQAMGLLPAGISFLLCRGLGHDEMLAFKTLRAAIESRSIIEGCQALGTDWRHVFGLKKKS
jgi:hypothetical protein